MRELLFWAIWILMFSEALNFLIKQGGSIWQSPWTTAFLGFLISLGTFRLGYWLSKVQIENKKSDIQSLNRDIESLNLQIAAKNEKLTEKDDEISNLKDQIKAEIGKESEIDEWLAEKDEEIAILREQLRKIDAAFGGLVAFYEDIIEAIKNEGIQILIEVRKVNKERNPDIINTPMPCTVERLSQALEKDREDINNLVRELKKLNLVSSHGSSSGYENSHIKDGDCYPLLITEKGRAFLFMHKLINK